MVHSGGPTGLPVHCEARGDGGLGRPSGHCARDNLFDQFEVFYNKRRRHSTLGLISPADVERR